MLVGMRTATRAGAASRRVLFAAASAYLPGGASRRALQLDAAQFVLPHPEKESTGGEDAAGRGERGGGRGPWSAWLRSRLACGNVS